MKIVFFIMVLVGIGWTIVQFPVIWKWLAYLIPTFTIFLFFVCCAKLVKTVKDD